ncbi:MAG TPA: HAD family hydrolase, partial [Candidatus Thermoplasmatota archaeon]|nr:HAD family hydrolase [Candidatus Thermoplasmatota archaeon]
PMPLRAVIFDGFNTLFDGAPTLREAIDEGVQAAHRALRAEGVGVAFPEFLRAYNRARDAQKEARKTTNREFPIEARIEEALRHLGLSGKPEVVARVAEAHMAGFGRFALVHPEAPEVLRELRRSYKLGVASNYYHSAHLHTILRSVGLHAYFDVVVASADVGYVKPHPAMFQEVLRRLDVRPAEALMVGDTPEHDVVAAQALGMRGCFIPDPRDPSPPACPEADLVIRRLAELPAALSRFGP